MRPINYSIIIPHYNIPDLLTRCLRSIPIRPDIQVIVVDDCSPNADLYPQLYPEFGRKYLEWYSTPQGGSAGRARNIGLNHAMGKWVLCIDADDLFTDNMEEILYEAVDRAEDILFYNYESVYSDDLNKKADRTYLQEFFNHYKNDQNDIPFRYQFEPIWCKIIRKELIDKYNIRCDETKYSNDVGFSIKIGYFAKTIKVIDKQLFIITQRSGSLASSFFNGNKMPLSELKIRMIVAMKVQNFLDKHNLGIEINTFNSSKKWILGNHQGLYFLLLFRYSLIYPFACKRLLDFWLSWKIKTIKKIFITA